MLRKTLFSYNFKEVSAKLRNTSGTYYRVVSARGDVGT